MNTMFVLTFPGKLMEVFSKFKLYFDKMDFEAGPT